MCERRLDYTYKDDRDIYLDKIKKWTTGREIKEAKENEEARKLCLLFRRYKLLGFPLSCAWGDAPAPLIELIELLEPVHSSYFPKLL